MAEISMGWSGLTGSTMSPWLPVQKVSGPNLQFSIAHLWTETTQLSAVFVVAQS